MDHSHHSHHNHESMTAEVPISASVDHSAMDHSQHGGHSMSSMSFHFGVSETVLFDFWKVESAAGMFLSCLLIIAACFVMEGVAWFRRYTSAKRSLDKIMHKEDMLKFSPTFSPRTLVDSLFMAVQMFIAYCLMLVFMTYNIWMALAVVVGEVLARTLFVSLYPNLPSGADECA